MFYVDKLENYKRVNCCANGGSTSKHSLVFTFLESSVPHHVITSVFHETAADRLSVIPFVWGKGVVVRCSQSCLCDCKSGSLCLFFEVECLNTW